MLIQDVERKTGLDRATIRFYEKEELIVPERAENGYRTYSEADIKILLKVKLLRQLGVSLPKIKRLQKGSADFSEILSQQIEILTHQINENISAKQICQQLQSDGICYADLDAEYYLQMLATMPSQIDKHFTEEINREVHPWRRYFARYLDYQILTAVVFTLIVVVLRIRPFTSMASDILGYAIFVLAIPVLSAMLHYWGTTPGKWAMGIRLESIQGGKLSGGEALSREGKVLWHGFGLFIPILNLIFLYRSYRKEKNGEPQAWNEDTEVIYVPWTTKRKIIAAILWLLAITLTYFAAFDAALPKYRGGVTIAEFAENHRDYEIWSQTESDYKLADDGKWQARPATEPIHYVFADPVEVEREEFVYTLNEKGEITSITFEESWEDEGFYKILPSYCENAIYVAIGSRPGSNIFDIRKAQKLLYEQYNELPQLGGEAGGNFEIRDVTINWTACVENCQYVFDGVMYSYSEKDQVIRSTVKLEIIIG